jgi:hypothetical protein
MPSEMWMLADRISYGEGEVKFKHLSSKGF